MKLGIVGSGFIVNDLLRFIKSVSNIELVGICGTERSKDILIDLANKNEIPNIYTDYLKLLENDEIDTIYLAMPNYLHYRYGKLALENGKNVIMEKPFTSNYNQALKLFELAQQNNVFICEAITNQFNKNMDKIAELVSNIGEIQVVQFDYSSYSSRYDAFKQGIIKPVFDVKQSGGTLVDLNVYNIHVAVRLFGLPKNVAYYPNIINGVDVSGVLILEYPSFKAVLTSAKNCKSPILNKIEADGGCIFTTDYLGHLYQFDYQINGKEKLTYRLDGQQHRMYSEFEQISKMIEEKNIEKIEKLKNQTLKVMQILTQARKSANIVFPDDEVI